MKVLKFVKKSATFSVVSALGSVREDDSQSESHHRSEKRRSYRNAR
jgi:hypothetical protein